MKRLWRDRRGAFGFGVLGVALLVALTAPYITSGAPARTDVLAARLLGPGSVDRHGVFHLLGTDPLGRDVWTRLAYGARISVSVSGLATLLSVVLGVLVGAGAGRARGLVRASLLGLTDFALAVPRVVLLLLLAALWEPSATLVVVVLGVTGWMPVARLVYAEVRALGQRPFVEGAVALGASPARVLWRHILANAWTPVIVAAAFGLGNTMLLEAGLSFLGVGVQPPAPSWGNMIAAGRDALAAPWIVAAPGVALVVVVIGCTLLGDALRDALEPRRQARV
jgi:peptide/nickel transport system permease protein